MFNSANRLSTKHSPEGLSKRIFIIMDQSGLYERPCSASNRYCYNGGLVGKWLGAKNMQVRSYAKTPSLASSVFYCASPNSGVDFEDATPDPLRDRRCSSAIHVTAFRHGVGSQLRLVPHLSIWYRELSDEPFSCFVMVIARDGGVLGQYAALCDLQWMLGSATATAARFSGFVRELAGSRQRTTHAGSGVTA